MTTGDPKQAVVLAVVAIGIVGFAVFRIIPKPDTTVGLPISPRVAATETDTKKLPTVVLSNAFWHARLDNVPGAPKSAPKKGRKGSTTSFQNPDVAPVSPLSGVLTPDENTGSNRQQIEGPTIRVSAIIATGQRKEALISFGGADEVKASAGMRFRDLIIVAVSDTSVRIRIGKAEKTLAVGEEQKLWINENKEP